jgi:16S rRNA (cytosine967-C5)-methyltransferase
MEVLQSTLLYEGPRGTAVKILNRIERADSYLDKLLDAELRSGELNDLDKGLLTEIIHGVMRWKLKLDWVLTGFFHGNFTKAEANVRNCLRVALYQILFLDRVPHFAVANEAVEFIKRIRGEKTADLVNAILRNILRNVSNIHYPSPDEDQIKYLSVFYSHPAWMVKRWVARYGFADTEKLLAANNEKPELTLRVNRLKSDVQSVIAYLDQHQVPHTKSPYLDYFIKVRHLADISQSEAFRQGLFTVQDESAGLPCLLLSPQPGERIVDLCAAPGGKTTFIGEIMKNSGEIVAVDKYESKLHLIKESCDRLGIRNVKTVADDGASYQGEIADRVLVDAPCTGLGVLAKKPDIKWKREPEDIQGLVSLQLQLLENAARLVKPGGVIVYSTCTIEPEENFELVRQFLNSHPSFVIDDPKKFVPAELTSSDACVGTLPSKQEMDGSFAARLIRNM